MQKLLYFVLTLMLLLLSGCATTSVLDRNQLNTDLSPSESVYIIVGEEIGKGNINAFLVQLFIGGERYSGKGILLKEAYENKKTPKLLGGIFNNPDYLSVSDRDRHAYRIWKIPFSEISKNGKAIAYPALLHAGDNIEFGKFEGCNTGQILKVPAPFEYEKYLCWLQKQPEYNFLGNSFEINQPGIYYLGEIMIKGTIKQTDMSYIFGRDFSILPGKLNEKKLYSLLSEYKIENLPFFDFSNFLARLSGLDFNDYVNGKKSEENGHIASTTFADAMSLKTMKTESKKGETAKLDQFLTLLNRVKKTPTIVREDQKDNKILVEIGETIEIIDNLPTTISDDDLNRLIDAKEDMEKLMIENKPKFQFIILFHRLCKYIVSSYVSGSNLSDVFKTLSTAMDSADDGVMDNKHMDALEKQIEGAQTSQSRKSAMAKRLSGAGEISFVYIASATNIDFYEDYKSRLMAWKAIEEDLKDNPNGFSRPQLFELLKKYSEIEEDDEVLDVAAKVMAIINSLQKR